MIDFPPFYPTELEIEYSRDHICPSCGSAFVPAPREVYCSTKCANESQKKLKRDWWNRVGKHSRVGK